MHTIKRCGTALKRCSADSQAVKRGTSPSLTNKTADLANPRTSNKTLSVTDGTTTAGYVVEHDGEFYSYDAEFVLLGKFASQSEATRAIPRVQRSG
jgi:hypothetical protein